MSTFIQVSTIRIRLDRREPTSRARGPRHAAPHAGSRPSPPRPRRSGSLPGSSRPRPAAPRSAAASRRAGPRASPAGAGAGRCASSSATSIARAVASSACSLTNPSASACSGETIRPRRMKSRAGPAPMIRGSRWVPPPPGMIPRETSGKPIEKSPRWAIRMSQPRESSRRRSSSSAHWCRRRRRRPGPWSPLPSSSSLEPGRSGRAAGALPGAGLGIRQGRLRGLARVAADPN
jgi:hypothetical protein